MSSNRIVYLRCRDDVQAKRDGTYTRGVPLACIRTDVDWIQCVIRYAVSSVHPKDTFDKKKAVMIASERLNGVDRRGKAKAHRDRGGAHTISGDDVQKILAMNNGHEITKLVMADIFTCLDFPERVRSLAADWLASARTPKSELPTLPAPKMSEETRVFYSPVETSLSSKRVFSSMDPEVRDVSDTADTIPVPRRETILPPPPRH